MTIRESIESVFADVPYPGDDNVTRCTHEDCLECDEIVAYFRGMIDRVPRLSAIPLIGKRFFEKVTYRIDSNISQEQLAEAYRWIKESADQGFAPAKEAENLFIGRIVEPNKDGAANRSQPIHSETNRTSSAAGSRR